MILAAGARVGETRTPQDIEAGSRLRGQCAQCHGPNGDLVSGINLRRGQFRKPLSDDDLRQTISSGVPAARSAPVPSDVSGMVVQIGDAGRGKCC
jgi:mono/diheme cytochrome c family protein